jgi:hypothetical protein
MNPDVVQDRRTSRARPLDADECALVTGGTSSVVLPPPCPLIAVIGPDGTITITHGCDPEEPPPPAVELF